MACYSGITTDLERRKTEHARDFKNLRNWQTFGPFKTRDEAQRWEDAQPCRHHPGGALAPGPWYGYRFDYDP